MPVNLSRVVYSSKEYRRTDPATSTIIADRDKLAGKLIFKCLFLEEADANDLRDQVISMRTPGRGTYTVEVLRRLNSSSLGDTITLVTDDLSVGTGNFIVKGLRQDTGTQFDTLTLYGPQ